MDRLSDEPRLMRNRIVVVGTALEEHGFTEADTTPGRQRQLSTWQQKLRQQGEHRQLESTRHPFKIPQADVLFLRSQNRSRDDRCPGREGEPHEAVTERLQLIALTERLGNAANSLGEGENRFLTFKQTSRIVWKSWNLADAH